ncbi:MAG: class I SAM-dependent methyltransferase [Ferruginibacter sp.]
MKLKQSLSQFIRKMGIATLADKSYYYLQYLLRYRRNSNFAKTHPDFIFPPAYFIYETYTLDYKDYLEDGKQTAGEIVELLKPFINIQQPLQILDWGCGPARVVRHMPGLLAKGSKVFACDYNEQYVKWGNKNIPEVRFKKNELEPPVALPVECMDAVYGLSIFTHLSEKNHSLWIAELYRLLKPGGIMLITTQGEKFIHKLLPDELQEFEKGKLIVRNFEKEGHRMYSAFQPEKFMQELLSGFKILKFIPGGDKESVHHMQDTWIAKKL